MKRLSLASLIKKLTDDAIMESVTWYGGKRKIGQRIEKLSDEERELLNSATSEDFNHRYP